MLRLVYPSLGGNDPTAVGFLSFAGILFAPSSLDCLFNGRAIHLGKSLREIAKPRFNNLSEVIG